MEDMASGNHCTVTEFFLAGLSEKPDPQMPLFLLFLVIYVITVAGNIGMVTLIVLSSHLHTPMYYFLSSLSFIDFCQSTVVTPKMLMGFVTEKNLISYPGCLTQLYFFIIFAIAECYTLAAMAYDRYAAICNPLLYNATMSVQIYSSMIAGVYIFGILCASLHIGFMIRIQFCELAVINHYFCDLFPLLKLTRSNIYINELLILFLGTLNIFLPILTVIASYIFIIASILRIRSTEGRTKAFSTCSSHILAVVIFFGSLAFMYLQPSSVNSMDQGKISSVFYTIVVPMLNPLIYSLRNKDVIVALKKILDRKLSILEVVGWCVSFVSSVGREYLKKSMLFRMIELRIGTENMATGNHCTVTEFFLAGLSEKPELQMPLFLLFLGIYVITVAGNLGMVTLIVLSSHLHNPMYYFLSSLSFIDFCQSTIVTPKMLVSFVTERNLISYHVCTTQLYFFIIFDIAECYTLAAMAYDRYVAICNPLLYNITMSYQTYSTLISGVYIFSILCSSIHTGFMIKIRFCKLDVINHYFCDLLPLLKLACSDTYINELLILFLSTLNIFLPVLIVITSYIFIIASILRIRSIESRTKAFTTCSSHILAVVIFFGSLAFMYLQPSSVNSMDQGKISSVFYTIVVPMLNPLIYSLRNKDVSVALKKILERKTLI
ncbi:olfactory receptor 1537-like [Sigmodon hispidus]